MYLSAGVISVPLVPKLRIILRMNFEQDLIKFLPICCGTNISN